METVQDTINRVRKELNSNILNELEGISLGNTPEETLAAIQSAPVQEAIAAQAGNGSSLMGDTLGAFGIGAANMVNDVALGGAGLILGNAGRIAEAVSPFSGWDNDTLTHLANLGMTPEEAYKISPHRDSWLTSMGKGALAARGALGEALNDARTQVIGNDPSFTARAFQGWGSNVGYFLTMLALNSNPLTAALAAGGLESLAEAGGMLGDAYDSGQYGNEALNAANKSFVSNFILNSTLNRIFGPVGKATEAIKNPFLRYLASGITEILNEEFQEPSQEVINQAAMNSLNNGTDFLPELGQSVKQWPETFKQLAPEVAASTLLSVLAGGIGGIATQRGRHNLAKQSVLSRHDTVTNPKGEQQLRTHQPSMDFLRQDFADSLTSQKSSLEDIINGIYQSGNEELDTNPDMMSDVQRNSEKLKTVNEQLEALSNYGKEAQIQQTIDEVQNTLSDEQDYTQEDMTVSEQDNKDLQEKPKKGRKKKNVVPQEDLENIPEKKKPAFDMEEDKQEDLPEFSPTEDTVNAYKAKNVAGSNTARVRTMKGTEVDIRYRIVDADDLIASTTERGAPNPDYLQELQPRDRGKMYSLEQIYRIGANPDPELLGANRMASDGAPIIGADMMVESGNGRVLALRKAYKDNTAGNYRAYLRDNAEMFGLKAEDVERVKKPVLVRERLTDVDRVKFTSEANESSIATMSASEHALDDAKKITPHVLSYYDTENSFEANKDFISGVISLLPKNEQADLIDKNGNISRAGLERVRYALAAKAYKDNSILDRLAELLDDEVKNISNALIQAAPKMAILESDIESGGKRKELSLAKDIMQAVNTFVNIKNTKKSVSNYLAQPALFDDAREPQTVRMLLEFFDKNIRAFKRMSNGLMNYAEIASEQANSNQPVLFEDSIRTKEDILEEALRRAVEEDENSAEEQKKTKNKNKKKSSADENISPTREDIYNSNFKRWFGDWEKHPKKASKVVDDNGEPLIVYHGTDAVSENGQPPFTEFETKGTSKGMHGDTSDTGAWFHSSKKAANSYGGYVYEVYLNIRNPYIYDCTGKNPKTIAKKKDQIVRDVRAGKYGEGYDGVIFRNIEDVLLYFGFEAGESTKGNVYVVFDKHQVKSADKNNGLYGQATGNIFKQSANPNLSAKEEKLRQDFKQKIIDAHRPDEEAEQLSHIYMAANRYFSTYTGIPLDKLMQADNFSTEAVSDIGDNENIRGRTLFFREKRDLFDTIIREARTIMQLTKKADSSSALHETGHIFLDKFRRLAASGLLKGKAKQDWATLVKELRLEGIDFTKPLSARDKQRLTDAHENFAASLEKYLMTGKAPNSKLKHAFEAFKRWLTDVYHSIRNIMYEGADGQLHTFDISPKVREVFDSMLGVDSSSDGSISNDESLIPQEDVEQYNQRTYYASGQPLKDNKFDFNEMRRARTGTSLLNVGPAWGVTTTQMRFDAKKYRTINRDFDKIGRIHFRNRSGKDAHEAVRQFKNKEYREAAEWVLLDLERRVDRDTTPEEFEAVKENLLETYRRVHAADKIHFIEQIKRMTVDKDSEGNLYIVDTPDDRLLLDGNLPLAKQPEHVRRAIRGIHEQLRHWGVSLWSAERVRQNPRQKDLFGDDPEIRNEVWNASQMTDVSGMDFYGALSEAMQTVIDRTSTKITSPKYGRIESGRMAASILLNRFGIPGLRVKRKGFYTYTTWNEDLLKVLGVSKDSDNETVREMKEEEQAQERQKRREMLAKDQPSAVSRSLGREGVLQGGEVRINLYGGDRGTEPSKHKVSINLEDESYNQVAGEKGATALADATGNFMITLNLKRAKLMTKEGKKTSQQIKLVTGWELAPDGEWRYEFPDGTINQKKIETVLPRIAKGFRFRKIFKRSQLNQNLPVSAKLSEFFDAPETFAAYPQLKDMVVTFVDKLQDGKYNGMAYGIKPVNGTNIALDANLSLPEMQSVLRHEVQHLIQEIEGFARGGTEEAGTLSGSLAKSVGSELIFNLVKNMSSQGQQAATLYLKNNVKEANKLAATLSENERKNLSSVRKIIQQIRSNQTLRLSNIYPFLGGEIEARNIQRRENLTPEQRKSTLLSDTEDVHSWIVRKNASTSGHATQETSFDMEDESYQQIGTKRKKDMDTALARERTDLSPEQRTEAIAEIEKLGETVRQGGNTKVEKAATHWLLKGHIILPEDNYKIIDAVKICEQQHLNPMSFDDPNTILAKYTIKESAASRRINPDTVPEFSNKVTHENGITIYTVEDTKAGQEAVRRIIDTHWGEDANPWCLAARQNGSLDDAWEWWNNYNATDKRIAFKDGKLLAFCASDDEVKWWDKEDQSHSGIFYTVKNKGDAIEYLFNEQTGKSQKLKEKLSDRTERSYYENEQMSYERLPDGTEREWYENGQMYYEKLPDGTAHRWYKNGQMRVETLPDGTAHTWNKNGQLLREKLPDGTLRYWNDDGQINHEELPDGTIREWYENGQMYYEKLPDGTIHEWYENGQMRVETLPDGTRREGYENGQLHIEILPDGTKRNYYENGQMYREDLHDHTIHEWYENGQMAHETLPDGTARYWDEDGQMFFEKLPDGTTHEWNKYGESYNQAAYSPRGFMRKIIDKIANSAKKIFAPDVKSAPSTSSESIQFSNEDTERRYRESMKGVQQLGMLGRIKHSTMSLIRSMKGDYPELGNNEGLNFAKEQFRMLQRKKSSQVKQAMQSFTENLRGLDTYQRDLFGRKRLLDDLRWRKQNYPDAELPFGFTDDMLKKEGERFDKLAKSENAVMQAIQREEQTMRDISNKFIGLAKELGLNLEGVLRNPHYYRHTVLEYANAAAMGMPRSVQRSNASLQDFVDSQLRGVTGRGYLKRYKGSALDISTNYVQANGEVRAQMLMDIEVMRTLGEIKKKYDIAPKLKQKLQRVLTQQAEPETHNQPSIDDQTISDIIPDGYTLYDPAGGRLIQSANSSAENIISMAVDDAARQSGLPLDRLLRSLGSMGEDAINRLLVIPNEIANALDKMSQDRDRGMLGNAAKLLTNWWKKAVLFSPTRNIKYNFRNFTGDLDALIAGNPKALKFFPQAVKELTAHYRGKNTTQDLQDYIDRSGGLNIDSMQITPNEANAIYDLAESEPGSIDKRGWNLIKKFFKNEVAFTAWRENLLRYAAYLAYKQDMEANDGTPSSWGASLKDEVLSLDDVRDKAYKMSNELLGAYDQISEFGQQLRDLMIPFWSWTEINLKRYYRLLKNGLTGQNSSDFAKRFLLAKSARVPFYAISAAETFAKISLFTMLAQAFNRFVFPDDDDELPPDIKYKPHLTLGKVKGQLYYFDRIGALGDAAEWLSLDNIVMDSRQLQRGSLSWGDFMKKVITTPATKVLQEVNPLFRMPYELATGRTIYPDASHPRMIKDNGAYISQTFGLSWPYKAATGKPRDDWQEFKNMFVYSADAEEAAYFYSLDMVRQFQERVLGKRFDGFAQTKRGQVLQKLKAALRFNDRQAVRQSLREYAALDGTKQGLKASMKSMNPLYGLSKDEQKKFMRWISQEDRKYLRKANRYFHQLADKYIR